MVNTIFKARSKFVTRFDHYNVLKIRLGTKKINKFLEKQDRSNQKDLVAATINAQFHLSKTLMGKIMPTA